MSSFSPRYAVLASGSGSTAEALAEAISRRQIPGEIALVIATNPQAGIYERVLRWNTELGFSTRFSIINNKLFPGGARDRGQSVEASTQICRELEAHQIDHVAQLGYMTIANAPYVTEWGYVPGHSKSLYDARATNSHPGPLPLTADTMGAQAAEQVLAQYAQSSGDELGSMRSAHTLHLLAQAVDAGPILAEHPVDILEGDTPESLFARTQIVEKTAIPYALNNFVTRQHIGAVAAELQGHVYST